MKPLHEPANWPPVNKQKPQYEDFNDEEMAKAIATNRQEIIHAGLIDKGPVASHTVVYDAFRDLGPDPKHWPAPNKGPKEVIVLDNSAGESVTAIPAENLSDEVVTLPAQTPQEIRTA